MIPFKIPCKICADLFYEKVLLQNNYLNIMTVLNVIRFHCVTSVIILVFKCVLGFSNRYLNGKKTSKLLKINNKYA